MSSDTSQAAFRDLIAEVTRHIAGRPLDTDLQSDLNHWAAADSPLYAKLFDACRQGVAEGWMCSREAGGIRYGRVIKPDPAIDGFSVDVVEMDRIKGPHHVHPEGEIDLVMPLEGEARFNGSPAGWKVYEPGSAHYPTVSDGRALVLYLLPKGAIQFTPGPDDAKTD
ncbi:uncharacterized protein DUF4863 [Panacagrimonas perspica]|uniref:Uncharacterized protein DUF4863 n=1 Tax=Panacagrimonas perspica TaxID=381431 RepID=A0A4S3K5L9_9GAMM|nr:DUF4863 family protein [Panacagrimonas perspica]TDU28001.1 uncharacterized protein DUF4863 [Panacagrimonas perspica]THD03425.1 DUF4863 domain-containing protein [Panacagrimonas perspica]